MKTNFKISRNFILSSLLILSLVSCNKRNDLQFDAKVIVNNNFDELNTRMKLIQEQILFTDGYKSSQSDNYGFTWYFVAEVEAPTFNGESLSASDVRILGDKAYISYNRQGIVFAGGVDILDISDPGYPSIRSYMECDGVDINSLSADEEGSKDYRELWLAGSSSKKGAILRQITTSDDYFSTAAKDIVLSEGLTAGNLSASANGVCLTKDNVFATSGNTFGGAYQIDRQTMEFVSVEEYPEAKAVAINSDYQITLIGGDNAHLMVYKSDKKHDFVKDIPLGSIVHQNVADPYFGKATVSFGEDKKIAFVAMNSDGMKAVDIAKGTVVYSSSPSMLTNGNTIGVAIDKDFVYMANSNDGMYIGRMPKDGGEIIPVQYWDLDESGASANMVQTDGDWVFIAKGGGGLKILRKIPNSFYPPVCPWDENGRPTCIAETETLCDNLVSDFTLSLMESKNATVNHPAYFQNENREILLNQTADVSITFISEGAGFKNSFGYYTYNVNTPPKNIEELKQNMKIVFANASATNSGGTLNQGDKVDLGTFETGTVIGYFMIANGWNGTKVTNGLYTFFTLPELNKNKTQQSIMVYNESCESLLTSFEDVHTKSKNCDFDYNDLVVKTTISPMSAMNTTNLNLFPENK